MPGSQNGHDADPLDDQEQHPTDDETELLAALQRGPVFAGDYWDAELRPAQPTLGEVSGANALLYENKSHLIVGEPGRGKTTLVLALQLAEARRGRRSVLVDYEKEFPDFRAKLWALGCTREDAAHIAYVRAHGSLVGTRVQQLGDFLHASGMGLVTVDGFGRALAASGVDENDNGQVRDWYSNVVEAGLLGIGSTVTLVDHPTKSGGARNGAPWARGAGAKLETITGAAYAVEAAVPFSVHQSGLLRIRNIKDNNGSHTPGEVVANARVTPRGEGRMDVRLSAPGAPGEGPEVWPVKQMGEVVAALDSAAQWMSTTAVSQLVGGGKAKRAGDRPPAHRALDRLVEVGLVEVRPGKYNANAKEWRRTKIAAPKDFRGWEFGPPGP